MPLPAPTDDDVTDVCARAARRILRLVDGDDDDDGDDDHGTKALHAEAARSPVGTLPLAMALALPPSPARRRTASVDDVTLLLRPHRAAVPADPPRPPARRRSIPLHAPYAPATLAIALFPIIDRLGGVGLVAATVREEDADPATLSSIFWLGIGASAAMTAALIAIRALLPFADPIVATLLVVYAARLFVRHLAVVPEALMKRGLRYRELSWIRLAGGVAETAIKLAVAYLGVHGDRALTIWCFILGPVATGWSPRSARWSRIRGGRA